MFFSLAEIDSNKEIKGVVFNDEYKDKNENFYFAISIIELRRLVVNISTILTRMKPLYSGFGKYNKKINSWFSAMEQDKENIISIFNDADVYHKDILSTWDDLFTSIGNKCNNDRECIVEILRFRGFLIDNINDDYYLSDNSHENDIEHLNDILRKYEIGRVDYDNRENFEITIKFNHKINRKNIEALKKSISESPRIGGEASDNDMSWPQFYSREHAYKVPVKMLEPFIARYIKSLSACGV